MKIINNIKTTLILLGVACACGVAPTPTRADTVLTSNLATPSNGWNAGVLNDQWVAAPFRTTSSLTRITGVTLDVYDDGNYNGGDIFAAIWSMQPGNAGPGSPVQTLYQGGMAGWSNVFTGLSVDLQPDTEYSVVVGGINLEDRDLGYSFYNYPGSVSWASSSDRAGQAHVGDGFVLATWYSQNQGASWSANTLDVQHLAVFADATPVPEIDPSGVSGVLSVVAGALAIAERRVRRGA